MNGFLPGSCRVFSGMLWIFERVRKLVGGLGLASYHSPICLRVDV